MKSRRLWTETEIKILTDMYPDHPAAAIAGKLARPVCSIYGQAHKLGLAKSEAFYAGDASGRRHMARIGINTRFKPGQISHNKGKRCPSRGRALETQFKAGQLPHNTRSDGYISIRRYGCGRRYKWIRVGLKRWELLHRVVWSSANGPIPRGFNVQFIDGNSMNCQLENLVLVSRKQNMKSNTIHNYPEELRDTFRVIGKLKKTIKDATK